jgi:hypothetical protein
MNLVRLISLLLQPPAPSDDTREVLRDYPGCGQLGSEDKKECIWGCEWRTSEYQNLNLDESVAVAVKTVREKGMC